MSKQEIINDALITGMPVSASVYFLGIGGIGMSALARYFNSRGHKVSGYDKTPTVLTETMIQEGIHIHFEENTELLDKNASLVVYTPAIPPGHLELAYYQSKDFKIYKRSEVLGMITSSTFNICIAGTHGKTTTSAMIAHILRDSGYGCNAFLGGISANYNTNFWSNPRNVCVAEADEYDRSFLKLNPDIAVITSMDADHLDIYGNEIKMQDAFIEFSKKVKPGGSLFIRDGLQRSKEFNQQDLTFYSASKNTGDGVYAANIVIEDGGYRFDVVTDHKLISNFYLQMGGRHNVENALVSIAVALKLGIDADLIRKAIQSFKGVKRRFEYIIKEKDMVFIDDYAHHPSELSALINGAKELYPEKKMVVVFQPHLFSRTRDLAEGFAEALDHADEVILLPIYPARELPVEGVSSKSIESRMKGIVRIVEKGKLAEEIKHRMPELLITAGAGDIDMLIEPLKKELS